MAHIRVSDHGGGSLDFVQAAYEMLRKNNLLAALIIFLATIGCYGYTANFSLISDDEVLFQGKAHLGLLRSIPQYFTSGVWDNILGGKVDGALYRPMFLIYVAMLKIVFGNNPFALHAASIVLHATNSVLFLLIASNVFSKSSRLVVMAGTLSFALHPVHVESISWISALTDLQATFFILLSFLFYIQNHGASGLGKYVASFACFVFALFSKELAVVFPVVLVAYDYVRRQLSVKRTVAFVAAAVVYYVCRLAALSGETVQSMELKNVDVDQATLLVRFIPAYFKQLVAPVDLPFFMNSPVLGYLSQLNLAYYGLVLALFICFVCYVRKDAWWGAAWLFLFLLPPLSLVFCNMPMLAVRYLYLPSVGFSIVVTMAMEVLYRKIGRPFFGVIVALAVLGGVFFSYREGQAFRNGFTLGEKILASSPESIKGHLFLASFHENNNNLAMSLVSLRNAYKAVKMVEEKAEACYSLGLFLVKNNNLIEGRAYLQEAIGLNLGHSDAYNALGNSYLIEQDLRAAILYYKEAVAAKENNYEALYNLARSYEMAGESKLAFDSFTSFLRNSPRQQEAELFSYAENFVQRYNSMYGK